MLSIHHSKPIRETRLPAAETRRKRFVRAENAMKPRGYLAHEEKERERDRVEAIAPDDGVWLVNRQVAAGEKAAGRITIAHLDGEEVVRARISIVDRINAKADSFLVA